MAKKSISKGPYDWVNYAKGLGIILVVYGHVARGIYNAGMVSGVAFYKLVDGIIYSFHMPLFFLLSGLFFVASLNRRGVKGLIASKINTIVYPYFVWSLVQMLIAYPFNGVTNSVVELSDIYSIIWNPFDQFWFLYSLFLIFVIYSLIYKLTGSLLASFVISVIVFFAQNYINTPWGIFNSVYRYGIYFCAGMLMFKFIKLPNNWLAVWVLMASLIFCAVQWYFHGYLSLSSAPVGKLLIVALVSLASAILLSQYMAHINLKVISYIGMYSLEIYVLHVILASGFRVIFQHVFNIQSELFHYIGGNLVGIVGPILIALLMKQWLHISFLFSFPENPRFQEKS